MFEVSHPLWWIIIPPAFLYLILLTYWPYIIPFSYLGPFGEFTHYLVSNYRLLLVIIVWSALIAHVYEAYIARRICQRLNIDQISTRLWIIQTVILGYPSLSILKQYARERRP